MQAKMISSRKEKASKIQTNNKVTDIKINGNNRGYRFIQNFQPTKSILDRAQGIHIQQPKCAKGRHILRRNGEGLDKASPFLVKRGNI